MDTSITYQQRIKDILLDYAQHKPAYGSIESRVLFDDDHGSYALLQVGWDGKKYIHGTVIHIDLIGEKIWIQYDGTEEGIATDLVAAGVPHTVIVLGFRPAHMRPYTGFAIQ